MAIWWLLMLALLSRVSGQYFSPLAADMDFSGCGPDQEVPNVRSDIECLELSSRGAQAISYRMDTGRCSQITTCNFIVVRNDSAVRAESNKILYQPGSISLMLFALKAGSSVDANSSYVSSASCNSSLRILPSGQVPTEQVWRSCWLDRMPELVRRLGLNKIVLHVIKGGSDVINITFNADFDGINLWSWFRKENVISYWPASLNIPTKSFNFFSIQGSYVSNSGGVQSRSFFINLSYVNCAGDIGYLVVMNSNDPCTWVASSLPRILYNVDSSKTWSGNALLADCLVITIQ